MLSHHKDVANERLLILVRAPHRAGATRNALPRKSAYAMMNLKFIQAELNFYQPI
jgi:hypothetical protein